MIVNPRQIKGDDLNPGVFGTRRMAKTKNSVASLCLITSIAEPPNRWT